MAGKRIVFGEDAARRIVAAVKRVEAAPVLPGRGAAGVRTVWNPGVLEARVTTAITQATTTAYGTGEAQIQIDDGSGNFIDDPAYPGVATVLNYSQTSGTIAVGKHIMIGWRNGGWRYITGDCP